MADTNESGVSVTAGTGAVHFFLAEADASGATPVRAHTGDARDWRSVGKAQSSAGAVAFDKDLDALRGMYRKVEGTRDAWDGFLAAAERAVQRLLT